MTQKIPSPHLRQDTSFSSLIRSVFIALAPALIWGLYVFGWRVLSVIAVSVGAAVLTEFLVCRFLLKKSVPRDGATALSAVLFAALLPPAVSLFIAALGGALAAGVKMAFGGTGKNPVNPALAAAALLYPVFSGSLTAYTAPFAPLPFWRLFFSPQEIASLTGDAAPLTRWAAEQMPLQGWYALFSGDVPGALGAVSALLLLTGGVYLLIVRAASPAAPLSFLVTLGALALIHPLEGGTPLDALVVALLSGGSFLGAFFLLTDPVTAPVTRWGRILYGVLAGGLTALLRSLTGDLFAMVYAILLANLAARWLDFLCRPRPYGGAPFEHLKKRAPHREKPEGDKAD